MGNVFVHLQNTELRSCSLTVLFLSFLWSLGMGVGFVPTRTFFVSLSCKLHFKIIALYFQRVTISPLVERAPLGSGTQKSFQVVGKGLFLIPESRNVSTNLQSLFSLWLWGQDPVLQCY